MEAPDSRSTVLHNFLRHFIQSQKNGKNEFVFYRITKRFQETKQAQTSYITGRTRS